MRFLYMLLHCENIIIIDSDSGKPRTTYPGLFFDALWIDDL